MHKKTTTGSVVPLDISVCSGVDLLESDEKTVREIFTSSRLIIIFHFSSSVQIFEYYPIFFYGVKNK